jgi:hypothetical protein
MTSLRTITVGLAIAVALAISLIGASAAFAQGPLSDLGVVVLHGTATLSGTIPAPPATGGSGTFTLTAATDACLIYSDPLEEMGPGDPIGGCTSINVTGLYTSIICGTGSVSGDATVDADDDTFYVSFTMGYVFGVGVMVVSDAASDDGDSGGVGAGIVELSNINNPGQPNECVGDTTEFQIRSAVLHTVFAHGH